MRRVPAADEKPLHWVGSSKRDFLAFPLAVKDDMGNALGIAQFGGTGQVSRRRLRAARISEEVAFRHSDRKEGCRARGAALQGGQAGL